MLSTARQTEPNLNYPCQTFHLRAYVQRRRANINSTVYHRSRRHTTCCSSSLRSDPCPEMVMHDRRTINHRFISIRIKKSNTVLCFCGRERKHDASGKSGECKYNILFDRKDSARKRHGVHRVQRHAAHCRNGVKGVHEQRAVFLSHSSCAGPCVPLECCCPKNAAYDHVLEAGLCTYSLHGHVLCVCLHGYVNVCRQMLFDKRLVLRPKPHISVYA